jgi:hypothetical protein
MTQDNDDPKGGPLGGSFIKRFRVYRTDIDCEPYECEGAYDTVAETLAHRRTLEWSYLVHFDGDYSTWPEFESWTKGRAI